METGVIESYSKESAALLLQKYNVFVTYLEEEGGESSFLKEIKLERKISRKDLVIFFRQLSVMLESRVPVVQSLASLAGQAKKGNFKKVIDEISNLVQEGVPLSGALDRYPKIFDKLYVNLIKSGEVSGNISGALGYLSEHLEREDDILSQLKQAMIYPIFVIGVLFIVLGVIIVEVMPKILELVKETDSSPPFFTVLMLNFYAFLSQYWWAILICVFLSSVLVIYYFRTKNGKETYDKMSLKTPFLGSFLKKVFLTRFCANISTLMTAGISINKALEISQDTINNSAYKAVVLRIGKEVSEGEKISLSLSKYPAYFPPFVVAMVKVGEETGKLDKTLMEIVSFYQKDIKRAIDVFSSLLEPIMIIFLGAIVAMMAISVLSPLYGALGTI